MCIFELIERELYQVIYGINISVKNPNEFIEEMRRTVVERGSQVGEKFNSIEHHLEQIGNFLVVVVNNGGAKKKTRLSLKDLVTIDPN